MSAKRGTSPTYQVVFHRALCSGCGREVRRGRDPITHTLCRSCEAEVDRVLEAERASGGRIRSRG